MVKLRGESERNREEEKILTALNVADEVIARQCHLKLTGNQEANLIAKKEIPKAKETNKMRDLGRVISELTGDPVGGELGKKREIDGIIGRE